MLTVITNCQFSLWWHKLSRGGLNVNAVTSQKLTDVGRGPTFYDCLVEVEAADEHGVQAIAA